MRSVSTIKNKIKENTFKSDFNDVDCKYKIQASVLHNNNNDVRYVDSNLKQKGNIQIPSLNIFHFK